MIAPIMSRAIARLGFTDDQNRVLDAMLAEARRCATCSGPLDVITDCWLDGNVERFRAFWACPSQSCFAKRCERRTAIRCSCGRCSPWRTIWTDPDALAALQRMIDKGCPA